MGEWRVDDEQELVLDGVREVRVGLVSGEIAVTGADGPARVEVRRLSGDPVTVRFADGLLDIGYDDHDVTSWFAGAGGVIEEVGEWVGSFLGPGAARFGRHGMHGWARRRKAVVLLCVPPETAVLIQSVSAETLVAGVAGTTKVRTMSGDVMLDGLCGDVRVHSAAGDVEAQRLAGTTDLATVSGDVTLARSTCPSVVARTVSGDVTLDCALGHRGRYDLKTVSGDVALWLPPDTSARFEATTVSGRVDTDAPFESDGGPGRRRVWGRVGDAGEDAAMVRVRTVSGDLTVLRRSEAA